MCVSRLDFYGVFDIDIDIDLEGMNRIARVWWVFLILAYFS